MTNYISNRTFDEIELGESATLSHTLTSKDILLFAVMSGDVNPAHVDADYAKSDFFHHIVAHGMWTGSLISTVLGTILPGPGTIYVGQKFNFLKPVLIGDTITAKVVVRAKHEEKEIVELECVCTNQLGKEVITGEATVIAPTEKINRKRVILPQVEFKKERCPYHERIIQLAKKFDPIKTAIVYPVNKVSLEGALDSMRENLIVPILIGPEHQMKSLAKDEKIDLSGLEIVDAPHGRAAAEMAVQMARKGLVEAIMKGDLHTDELLHPVVDKVSGLQTDRRISHVSVIDTPAYPRPLFVTDAAVNIFPHLNDKKDIIQNAIDLFQAVGFGIPKVAILSAIETVSEKIPSTLDATALCKMAERGQITGGLLDGPLAFDNALSEEAAHIKKIHSAVAGRADILVVPDVESGNMLLKQLILLADATFAGLVMGAKVPIILTSRSSSLLARTASSALALLYLRNRQQKNQNDDISF